MSIAVAQISRLRTRLAAGADRFRYGLSALDQMALSVFGFGLNLYLVRVLSATDFGIVTLWMAMALLAVSIQGAVVSGPLSVHIPASAEADPERAARLAQAVGTVNLLLVAAATVVVVVVNMSVNAEWVPADVATAIAIPFFIAGGLLREYHRSVAFSRRDMRMLLWTDIPYLAVTSACLAAMFLWPRWFGNVAAAFFAMTIGCLVSQAFLRGEFRRPKLELTSLRWVDAYRAIAGDVGWAVVGVITTHLRSRSYIYVTVNMVSLAGLAAINVVGIFFRPVRLVLSAWSRAAFPTLSAQIANGRLGEFDRAIAIAFVGSIAASGAWFAVLWFAWEPIDRYLLADNYPDAWILMWPWAVAATLNVMEYTVSVALQAARDFKFLAHATMASAPVTIAATVAAVWWQGYTWTMYGVALGNLFLLLIEGARLMKLRARISAGAGLPPSGPGIAFGKGDA